MALGVALRYVLEALRKVPGSKMYMFGTTALDRFKTRYALFDNNLCCVEPAAILVVYYDKDVVSYRVCKGDRR